MSRPSGPRIRSVKPERYQDERMAGVSRDARHLYDGLTLRADDEGRGTANAALIKANVLPFDDDATPARIGEWLAELERARLVVLYEVDGRGLVQILSWADDQRVDKPRESKLPPPPDGEARDSSRTIANVPASRASKTGPGPGSGPDLSSSPDGAETEISNVAPRPEVALLSRLLADLMLANDPGAKVAPDSARWLDAIRLLLDRDGRDPALVERVIRWSQADAFWLCQIHSPSNLRSKFGQLLLKMQAGGSGNGHAPAADFAKYDAAARAAA